MGIASAPPSLPCAEREHLAVDRFHDRQSAERARRGGLSLDVSQIAWVDRKRRGCPASGWRVRL
jgi:hypothetical protein